MDKQFVRDLVSGLRANLARRQKHFELVGFDHDVAEVEAIVAKFSQTTTTIAADAELTATGRERAIVRAGRAASESLEGLSGGSVKRLRDRVGQLRADLLAEPASPDNGRLPNLGDLKAVMQEAWMQARIWDQIVQLPPEQRNRLAETATDPALLAVLASPTPVIRTAHGVAHVESLVAVDVVASAKLARARRDRGALGEQFDELVAHLDAIDRVIANTREKIGQEIRARSSDLGVVGALSGAKALSLAVEERPRGAGG